MNKSTIYIIIISLLLICNGIFAYLFFSKPGPPPHKHPREVIIERLHFSEDQVKDYDELIDWHRSVIVKSEDELKELKDQLFLQLLEKDGSDQVDHLIMQIGQAQMAIEYYHFEHFKAVQKLCTSEQEDDFKELVGELGMIFAPPHQKKPQPH